MHILGGDLTLEGIDDGFTFMDAADRRLVVLFEGKVVEFVGAVAIAQGICVATAASASKAIANASHPG